MHGLSHRIKSHLVAAISKVGYALGTGLNKSPPSLRVELERRAVNSTADYVERFMPNALLLNSHKELLSFAITRAMKTGLCLEFGVYSGNTIREIRRLLDTNGIVETVYGFDSFQGLPEDWSGYVITKETFDMGGKIPRVGPNIKLIPGFFDLSIPAWLEEDDSHDRIISFLHIDSDLYSSAKCIFDNIGHNLTSGSLVLFDEYFNYPNWQNHEHLAFSEFCEATKVNFEYLAIFEQKVLVKIK